MDVDGSSIGMLDGQTSSLQHSSGPGVANVDGAKRSSLDLISQLESDLALMLQVMSSSLHFLASRSAHVQLSDEIPLFQPLGSVTANASRQLIGYDAMADNIEELTDDLVGKAKEMERLIQALPRERDETDVKADLKKIDEEMVEANEGFLGALDEALRLRADIGRLLRGLCDGHQSGRARLAASVLEEGHDTKSGRASEQLQG